MLGIFYAKQTECLVWIFKSKTEKWKCRHKMEKKGFGLDGQTDQSRIVLGFGSYVTILICFVCSCAWLFVWGKCSNSWGFQIPENQKYVYLVYLKKYSLTLFLKVTTFKYLSDPVIILTTKHKETSRTILHWVPLLTQIDLGGLYTVNV